MKTFFRGTLLLVITFFFAECVEFLVNMVLAKELGEKGMGLYMTILPTIFLIVILASMELPVSISKFIAEQEEKLHRSMLKHTTKLTIFYTGVLMILATLFLPYVPVFDNYHPYVRWLVVILIPVISFTSIARGYFMGVHAMGKIAVSHFLRKLIQLVILVFVYQLLEFQLEVSLLIALCTLVASDIVIFAYLFIEYIASLRALNKKSSAFIHPRDVRKSLLAVSLPTTGLRIFHSVSHAIQPFLIKAALIKAGLSDVGATEHYGLLAGVALTIGFFPSFIAHSLLIVLIPTVSKAHADKDYDMLFALLRKVMKFTSLYAIPAVIIFYFFAKPLTRLFFDSPEATLFLQILWPYFLFHFYVIPLQAFMIGIDMVKEAFFHDIWSTIISFILMFCLGSMQFMQMEGIIIGMNTGAVLLFFMHYLVVCRTIGVSALLTKPSIH